MKTVYKILLAAASVFFVSGLIRICGLSDYMYFNKSLLSAALFLLTVFLSGRTWKEISRDKRRGLKRGEIRKQAKTLISSRLWTAGKQVTSE